MSKKKQVVAISGAGKRISVEHIEKIMESLGKQNDELRELIKETIKITKERLSSIDVKSIGIDNRDKLRRLKKSIEKSETALSEREKNNLSMNDVYIETERMNFIINTEATTVESLNIDVSRIGYIVDNLTVLTNKDRRDKLNDYFSNSSNDKKSSNRI